MTDRNCIICCDETDEKFRFSEDCNTDQFNTEESSNLKLQLPVIFLLRYFLDIPQEMCVQLLTLNGNPESWVYCCSSCSASVDKAKHLYNQITSLEYQLKILRKEVFNVITSKEVSTRKILKRNNKGIEASPFEKIRSYIQEQSSPRDATIKIEVLNFENENSFSDNEYFPEDDGQGDTSDDSLEDYRPGKASKRLEESSVISKVRVFSCEKCQASFSKKCYLSNHLRKCQITIKQENEQNIEQLNSKTCEKEALGKPRISCDICGKGYLKLRMLVEHYRKSHPSEAKIKFPKKDKPNKRTKLYYCETCGKQLSSRQGLRVHMKRRHAEEAALKYPLSKPYELQKCPLCDFQTLFRTSMKKHRQMHTGERPHKCDICDQTFISYQSLSNHLRSKHYEQLNLTPFKCEECGKMMESAHGLILHVKTVHEKDFTVFCEMCDKGFVREWDLRLHVKRHKGEKSELCSECGKTFTTKSQLKNHTMVNHTRDLPCACEYCAKRFLNMWKLKRHINSMHNENKQRKARSPKSTAATNKTSQDIDWYEAPVPHITQL